MQDILQNAIAKEGKFLLEQNEDDEDAEDGSDAKWSLNGAVVESLLTARAKYLLSAMLAMIVKPDHSPEAEAAGGKKKLKFLLFEDVDAASVEGLYDLLVYMCRADFRDSHDYIVELESRFMLQQQDTADYVNIWSSMWTDVFNKAISARGKHEKTKKDEKLSTPDKLLPAPKVVISKSLLKDAAAQSAGSVSVKAETGTVEVDTHGQGGASVPDSKPLIPYFATIYTASTGKVDDGKGIHTMDVLSVQAQIQQTLMMRAGRLSLHYSHTSYMDIGHGSWVLQLRSA